MHYILEQAFDDQPPAVGLDCSYHFGSEPAVADAMVAVVGVGSHMEGLAAAHVRDGPAGKESFVDLERYLARDMVEIGFVEKQRTVVNQEVETVVGNHDAMNGAGGQVPATNQLFPMPDIGNGLVVQCASLKDLGGCAGHFARHFGCLVDLAGLQIGMIREAENQMIDNSLADS